MNRFLVVITMCLVMAFVSCKSTEVNYVDISISDLNKRLTTKENIILLDVRTAEEIRETGKIDIDAMVIDYRDEGFEDKVKQLDKNQDYIVYCRSGGRSAKAANVMSKAGFKNVSNLLGGITAWQNEQ